MGVWRSVGTGSSSPCKESWIAQFHALLMNLIGVSLWATVFHTKRSSTIFHQSFSYIFSINSGSILHTMYFISDSSFLINSDLTPFKRFLFYFSSQVETHCLFKVPCTSYRPSFYFKRPLRIILLFYQYFIQSLFHSPTIIKTKSS